jgi:uncharacterized damage-inducible protein DinB
MADRETRRLEEQLERALEGESWHGPSLLECLEGVSAKDAAAHPIAGAHSIWEIALHLAGTYRLVLRRLAGEGRPLTPEEDWPALPAATPAHWRKTVEELSALDRRLREAVRSFPEGRLDRPLVPDVPYTAYTQFIGTTQHNLYHAGQIMMLKRALRAG